MEIQFTLQNHTIYTMKILIDKIYESLFSYDIFQKHHVFCNVIMRWYGIIMKGYAFMSTDIICKCAERAQYRFDKMFVNAKWGTLLSNYQV